MAFFPHTGHVFRGPILGKGATATVSLATSSVSGHVFAVKSSDISSSAPLQREQHFLGSIGRSQHIISYLGCNVTRSSYNLFLEFAPSGSLGDEIRWNGKGCLEECQIKGCARDILMGLSHLHSRGVAHCDVKPRNILLAADGTAKLADFGCARWIGGVEDKEGDFGFNFNGTPMYMAPEVARGDRQGAEADVWAVGCTVVEMATGRPPWPDATEPVSAIHRIAFSEDVPVVPKGLLSDEASEFLDMCLKRDPSQRWTAERLLQHPFIAAVGKEGGEDRWDDAVSTRRSPNYWPSPKCVLDQDDFWGSTVQEEEHDFTTTMEYTEDEAEHDNNPAERLRKLALPSTSSAAVPNWDSEDWITVRSGSGEEATKTAFLQDCCGASSRVLTPSFAESSCLAASPSSSCSTATTTSTGEESAADFVPILRSGDGNCYAIAKDSCISFYHSSCNSVLQKRGWDFPPRNTIHHCCYILFLFLFIVVAGNFGGWRFTFSVSGCDFCY